ncbi:MAG: hypothetical protein E6Q58_04390 [Niabella sp.]|nr:MAG: hypothetical protein E6Q58_04390 [Niabella sp.]
MQADFIKNFNKNFNFKSLETPQSEEIMELLGSPDNYGLERYIFGLRIPDGIFCHVNPNSSITIDGVLESKLGFLNPRSLDQLYRFESTLRYLADFINQNKEFRLTTKLRDIKLKHLWAINFMLDDPSKDILTVSENFVKVLALPDDRDIERPENFTDDQYLEKLFYKLMHHDYHNPKMQKIFTQIFKSTYVIKMPLSVQNIADITDAIYPQVLKKL